MPASAPVFAIDELPAGTTLPADCALQSIEDKESVDKSTYPGGDGVTAGLIAHNLITREVTLELKGKVPLTGVVAGAFTEGTLKPVSAKFSETVDDVPSGSVTYKAYSTRS